MTPPFGHLSVEFIRDDDPVGMTIDPGDDYRLLGIGEFSDAIDYWLSRTEAEVLYALLGAALHIEGGS